MNSGGLRAVSLSRYKKVGAVTGYRILETPTIIYMRCWA